VEENTPFTSTSKRKIQGKIHISLNLILILFLYYRIWKLLSL